MITYRLPVLAVRDVKVSKRFYHDLFDQEVKIDLGRSITFSGGFAVQEKFDELTDVPEITVLHQSHNLELYFEVDDFDAFMDKLHGMLDVELVHTPKTNAWGRRVVRLYDPDWHMIAVAESLGVVVKRLLGEGLTMEQIAQITRMPEAFVEQCRKGME